MKPCATKGNVVIKIDLDQKTKYRFPNGQEIFISRGHEYNLRLDNPNVAEVLDAENIPTGSLCLIHHNACQDSYKVFELQNIFCVPTDLVFLYNFNGEWQPNTGFLITQRIYKPYKGFLIGIENERIKNRLWVDKGIHAGKCVIVLRNSDYRIVYFIEGREYSLIRTREREVIGEDAELAEKIKTGEYFIGVNSKSSKPLQHA